MSRQGTLSQLKERFIFLYPDYKTRSYFLPPVLINRIPFERETVVNQTVLKPKFSDTPSKPWKTNKTFDETSGTLSKNHPDIVSPGFQYSDLREDLSLQLVKSRLQYLAAVQNEVMFVLSKLEFSDYLSKPCYSSTIEQLQLVLPRHLEKNEYKRGDFDLLLFHKKYGILIGEIKSVGSPYSQQNDSQMPDYSKIQVKVTHSIEQLDKAEVVIRELTKDLEPSLRIVKTVILPYIWRTDLQRVITDDVQLQNKLVSCLNSKKGIRVLDLCLLADNVSDCKGPWEIQQILSWWENCVSSKVDPLMNDDLYVDILVRFCGPATTIRIHCIHSPRLEVRTEGEAVSVVGERMTQLILTPEQLQLLCEMPRNVFLCGPPGTGKSVLLALMALKYLYKGDDVYVMSTVSVNIAASLALKNMLEKTIENTTTDQHGDVHYVQVYLELNDDEATKLISTVSKAAGERESLFAVVDEVWAVDVDQINRHFQCTTELCKLDNVNFWVACLRHDKIPPELQKITLTTPLRSPPTVLAEIEKSITWYTEEKMRMYRATCLSAPCDGPAVIHLQHDGHEKRWSTNCEQCGQTVGKILKTLGVGEWTGKSGSNVDDDSKEAPPLTFRDVFVLTRSTDLQSCGFATGLCQSGISKVRVLKSDCSLKEREDVALARNNEVILTWYFNVMGLERKVVVFLPHRNKSDDNKTDDELEAYGRNHAMSRCTSQLIVVHTSLSREKVNDI